jgi:hypothetical protein
MAEVVPFPQKLCAMCGRRATQSIDLVDEYGREFGHKHMCDDYPFCTEEVREPLARRPF